MIINERNLKADGAQTIEELQRLVEKVGLSYIHSSGCAVLKNGRWIQPEQWSELMERMAQ